MKKSICFALLVTVVAKKATRHQTADIRTLNVMPAIRLAI